MDAPENTLEEKLLAEVVARDLEVPEVEGLTFQQELLEAVFADEDDES